ncbi:single-strand binding protein [Carboxydocella thermautotrophica]|nr:single-strand binding protein [Carboxydocella thermautotrophica]
MLNRIILIGRLTRDPELRYTNTGKAVARFTLAIDRPFKNQAGEREADFINVVVWGQMAENCSKYLSKGKLAAVDGRLETRSFEGKDGNRRQITEVVAENVRFLSPRSQPEPGYNDGLDDLPDPAVEAGDLPF